MQTTRINNTKQQGKKRKQTNQHEKKNRNKNSSSSINNNNNTKRPKLHNSLSPSTTTTSLTPSKGQSSDRHKRTTIQWHKISSLLPQFLDAESSVTAAKFGARRLPEMKSLWRTFVCNHNHNNASVDSTITSNIDKSQGNCNETFITDVSYYQSRGCKLSNRHLRRRTGSHFRKKRHRFPKGSDHNLADKNVDTTVAITTKTKIMSTDDEDNDEIQQNNNKSRKARRKPAILKEQHGQWKKRTMNSISDSNSCTSSTNNTVNEDQQQNNTSSINKKWLETHLWHSKRFIMSPPLSIYNNWCIPLGHTNRGSKAAIRLAKMKCTLQDTTWTINGRVFIFESMIQDNLIQLVSKMCGGNQTFAAPFLRNKTVLLGLEVGYGFIYDLDIVFPLGMVGPASFQFGLGYGGCYFCKVLVDCSMHNDFIKIATKLIQEFNSTMNKDNLNPITYREEPLAMLKVRGNNATNAIVKSLGLRTLKLDDQEVSSIDWNVVSTCQDIHMLIKKGTIIHAQVLTNGHKLQNVDIKEMSDENKRVEFVKDHIHDVEAFARKHNVAVKSKAEHYDIILVSQCSDNVLDTKGRIANSGWDIFCVPEIANELFLALNHHGEACSIGLIEASSLAMESDPPQPLWPRDFPDTYTGVSYWTNKCIEWKLVRYCIEEGMSGGRIHTVLSRLLKECCRLHHSNSDRDSKTLDSISHRWKHCLISWNSLNSESVIANDNEERVTVIRGPFIVPFIQGLSKWCPDELLQSSHSGNCSDKQRRPRRKVSYGCDRLINIPPFQKQLFDSQKKNCSVLFSSLSMFTLLRCQIFIIGKGKLSTGMKITSMQKEGDDNLLGFVVSGMFSQSYGCYHGTAFICSKRFLSLQLTEAIHGTFMLCKKSQSPSYVTLKVHVSNQNEMESSIASLKILP